MKFSRYEPAELKFLAESCLRRGDYENAARFFRYLMVHFRMAKDESNYKKFAIKAGECYLQAAEKLRDSIKAIMLYLRAAKAFREGGRIMMINLCSSRIWESYTMLREGKFEENSDNLHMFKVAGDYFMDNDDFRKAAIIYHDIAEKALDSGRLLLAGEFYRNTGVCYQKMNNLDEAVSSYIKAADLYFSCQKYFEAAWNYCKAGFLLIHLYRFREASAVAEKAKLACREGQVEIFLRDLIRICKSLSRGRIYEATENWQRIKWKLSREYIQLVENSFRMARMKWGN